MFVTGTYNPYLVALSILVACFASYTALDLSGHVGPARGFARRVWLVAAALTMGGGIWSMHFVAMLAFIMPIPMSYDIGLTTLSLVVAIFVTGVGFYVISRQSASPLRLVLSGIFMGLGIAGHALHRHGGNAGEHRTQLRPAIRCALPGHSDRRVDRGALGGIPNHRSWAKARCRGRHGPGHFRYALHGDESGHFLLFTPRFKRGPNKRKCRSNQSGASGCRHYVSHSGFRIGRLPVRAEARRRSASSGAGESRARHPRDDSGRADGLDRPRS